jgi:hypothetical protein
MREFQQFQKEMQQQKEQEIAEIIENYAPEGNEAEAKMLGHIFKLAGNQNPICSQQMTLNPEGGDGLPADQGILTDEQAAEVAEKMKKQRGLKKFIDEIKMITPADFEKIKKCL